MNSTAANSGIKRYKFKLGLGLISIGLLVTILLQNAQTVDMEILFWKLHMPLVLLLLITALLTSLVVFTFILILGKD